MFLIISGYHIACKTSNLFPFVQVTPVIWATLTIIIIMNNLWRLVAEGLKEHVALYRSSWSLKSILNRLV